MAKKKQKLSPTIKGIIVAVLVIPTLVFFRGHLSSIWAQPEEVSKLKTEVKEQKTALEQIAQLSLEQKARLDTQEKVSTLQIETLKESIKYMDERRRK